PRAPRVRRGGEAAEPGGAREAIPAAARGEAYESRPEGVVARSLLYRPPAAWSTNSRRRRATGRAGIPARAQGAGALDPGGARAAPRARRTRVPSGAKRPRHAPRTSNRAKRVPGI